MAVEVVPTRAEHPLPAGTAVVPADGASTDGRTTDGIPTGTGPRWLLPALLGVGIVALLSCLLAGGTVGSAAVSGLPDAGPGTGWALPIASFIAETAAVVSFGAALLGAVLIPARRQPGSAPARMRAVRTAGMLSWLAGGGTVVVFVLTLSDLTARPLPQALELAGAAQLASFGPGRLLLIAATLSLLGGVLAHRAGRRLGNDDARGRAARAAIPVVIVLAGALIPWALGGHATQSGQDIASSSMIVHVLAAGAWVGGLAVVVMHVRGELLVAVLPRFSALALGCWIAVGTSGVITGWLRLTTLTDLWTTSYGRLLLVKLGLLCVLGGFGAWHRGRLAVGLRTQSVDQRRALLRLAAVEVLVMGATMGVATALSGTAPPAGHVVGHDLVHGTSRIEGMVGHKLPVISAQNLLLLWRPDVLVLLLTAVLLAGYLVAVRRRAAAGLGWPVVRIFWAVAAAALTVFVLDSGVAGYANAVWSVTVAQQAVTSMLIPLAIASARPWELFESPATSRLLDRLTAHPGSVLVLSLGWSAAALLTPVALWSVSSHAVLVATRLGDIAVGTALFAALSVPAGAAAQSSRRTAGRLGWLAGWFAGQAAITGLLLSGGAAAREWFSLLNIAWITVSQDEQTAALIRFGVAVAVFAVTIVVTAAQPPASKTAPTSSAPKTRSEFGEFGPSTPTISPEYPHVQ